jgi:aminopeptidase N
VRRIVQLFYDKFGVDSELNEERRLDNFAPQIAINLACTAGHQTCLSQSSDKLKGMFQNGSSISTISPDVQSSIYCNGLRGADSATFLMMRDKMIGSNDQAERTILINALGCVQNENLLMSLLYLTITNGNNFRLQEKSRVLVAPLNSGIIGLKVMIDFIELNHEAISEISSSHVNTMLMAIASRIPTNSLYTQFKLLLTLLKSKDGISESTHSILLESASVILKWQNQYLSEVTIWFDTENQQTTVPPTESTTTTHPILTTDSNSTPKLTTENGPTKDGDITVTTTQGSQSILVSTLLIITCFILSTQFEYLF